MQSGVGRVMSDRTKSSSSGDINVADVVTNPELRQETVASGRSHSIKQDVCSIQQSKRLPIKKRFSSNWITDIGRKNKYCICKTTWRKKDNIDMYECDFCKEWYHLSCLKLRLPPNTCADDMRFVCGQQQCNSGKPIFKLRQEIRKSSEVDTDILETAQGLVSSGTIITR